ncbi:MAG: DUF21 domain-containing protein, partial [Bacteroidales bacterium]|nr:DUF21 domain-containing protein [Bacteroidales bacterium]
MIANIPCAIFLPLSVEHVVCFVIGILLLILLAAVSAAEAAFMSLTPEIVKGWKEDHRSEYKRMAALMREPEKLLATMQVTGALVNIAFVVLAAHTAFSMAAGELTAGVMALVTVVIILLLLVFGEIVPRMYAS